MKDIRKDLQERLDSVRAQREHFLNRIAKLNEQEKSLEILLQEEEAEWKGRQLALKGILADGLQQRPRTKLTEFIHTALSDGNSHTLDDLVRMAQRQDFVFNGKSPRRTINFGLLAMKNNNQVEMLGRGVWRKR
jgi:hypothetical protein